MKTYMLSIYNVLSGQTEDIEVSEAIYNEYRRGLWRIKNNNRRFRNHETTFSELKGGADGHYENFSEFCLESDDPDSLMVMRLTQQQLLKAVDQLDEADRLLFCGKPCPSAVHSLRRSSDMRPPSLRRCGHCSPASWARASRFL